MTLNWYKSDGHISICVVVRAGNSSIWISVVCTDSIVNGFGFLGAVGCSRREGSDNMIRRLSDLLWVVSCLSFVSVNTPRVRKTRGSFGTSAYLSARSSLPIYGATDHKTIITATLWPFYFFSPPLSVGPPFVNIKIR